MEGDLELENGFSPFPDFLQIYNSEKVSQRVIIPSDYIKYYPKPLPQTAILKKPEGKFWNVKWKLNREGVISLEEGWPKFVKDNEIMERDYVLFTYDGSRTFWIRIYCNGLLVNPTAPINIEEISDDEEDDETTGGDDDEDKDSHDNMIVSLSLGSEDGDGDDDDEDYDNTMVNGSSLRGSSGRKNCIKDPETYLDCKDNPFFTATSSCTRRVLVIAQQAIKDYGLNFGRTVNLIDGVGEVERNVGEWKDRVVLYKWDEILKRNKAKPQDTIICEILRDSNESAVHSIKVHFIKK